MQPTTSQITPRPARLRIQVVAALLMSLIALAALSESCVPPAATVATAGAPLSAAALEEQYGVRVTLVALTAASGMVDVRMRVLDAGKAAKLIGDGSAYPGLEVPGASASLQVIEESKGQPLRLQDEGMIFLLYSNSAGVVKRGTPVTIVFGSTRLAPVAAQQ